MVANVEIRHIEAFRTLAETLHFGRAAEQLGISQPALSRTISRLEDEIGASLFARTTRDVALTDVGRALFERAPDMIESFVRNLTDVQRAASGETGRLTVGYMDFAINGTIPALVNRFRVAEPGIGIELAYIPTIRQRQALLDGMLDIGFLIGPFSGDGIETIEVEHASLVALLPQQHPLARARRVTLDRLADESWVLGAPEPWQAFRSIVFDLCARHGFAPRIVQEASNSDGIFGLVAAGLGISLYSACARNIQRQGVTIKDLDTPLHLSTVAAWRSDNANPAVRRFVAMLRG